MQVCIDISYINTHLNQHFAEFIAEIWHKIKIAHTLCSISVPFFSWSVEDWRLGKPILSLRHIPHRMKLKWCCCPVSGLQYLLNCCYIWNCPWSWHFSLPREDHIFFQINLKWSARTQKHVCIVCSKGVKLWYKDKFPRFS